MGSRITVRAYQDGDFGNTINFVGNLGRDAEMSYTTAGKAVTKFPVAVWQGKDKDSIWFNCVCWEDLAEAANMALKKGKQVKCVGRLTYNKYTDKNNIGRDSYQVTVTDIQIIVRAKVTVKQEMTDLDREEEELRKHLEGTEGEKQDVLSIEESLAITPPF